ncbi:Fcf2-domain-containing protein [Hyaloscypha hepaticicola]|uniref:Fcf2-domain-containing protein n=1 Tax=Hyaloscypha hepaticicola TaxID=2082293 RepID=A0A2J6PLJ1_9HELO|nr:Fcf2-domain-containing protein [Hyaloscypha hepaticicola]
MADEDLSDEQVRQLLKDAEERLRSKRAASKTSLTLQNSIPKLESGKAIEPYIKTTDQGAYVDPSHFVSPQERKLANGIRVVEDPVAIKAKAAKEKKATAGADWYNLPRTNLTPELKRDLQLLRMRDVLDPKRFYKKENSKPQIPEFSQVGTIIEGPTEYFSGRLSNKERKRTLVEEILAGEKETGRFKSKYQQIQEAKTSGKKEHYKKMKAMRKKSGSKG